MGKIITANTLVSKHVRQKDRVLLVNPPVEETRYSWLRWNQPLDLLKIGAFLRSEVGCTVALLDCLRPNADGTVREKPLPRGRNSHDVRGHRYPMRRFGEPATRIEELFGPGRRGDPPTQVWITSLCGFWFEAVAETCRIVQQSLPDAQVVLLGQYPRLMPKHASDLCAADWVVSKPLDLAREPGDLGLYGNDKPLFVGVEMHPDSAAAAVAAGVEKGIVDVAFFTDDVCVGDGEVLREIVEKTQDLHKHLRYHVICGLSPSQVTPAVARVLAHPKIAELHFEEADADGGLDVDGYRKVRAYLREAGMEVPGDRTSGFVWLGRPGDVLEDLVLRTFRVLDAFGGLILKPFTPLPEGPEHKAHKDYLKAILPRDWSPHFFPFAELNGITREEYHDLYRMAAFLNEKVRDRAFDFLNGTLGAQMLRDSLRREVWNLEPSPLRLVD
jgi:hypothetical protein